MTSMSTTLINKFQSAIDPRKWHFPRRCLQMIQTNWYLGLTSFGGPAVHFQIFHKLFVEKLNWINEQMALPGPASTKMLFGINSLQFGLASGILSFLVWSLPGAIAAYGFAAGVANIDQKLPGPVYALLSGLNAAIVGVVLVAAVQLSQRGITDTLSRIVVFLGAAAGLLYNTLWYFPVLMVAGGLIALIHDYRWVHRALKSAKSCFRPSRPENANQDISEEGRRSTIPANISESNLQRLSSDGQSETRSSRYSSARASEARNEHLDTTNIEGERRVTPDEVNFRLFSWKAGIGILVCFFASFITVITLRQTLSSDQVSRGFELFANLFLAGTIIFGGGPVVIPLLREYVVAEGWVSPRDFLLGLAVIQAFPGPNFNFAVYLGALAVQGTEISSPIGALIAFLGIFAPGLILYVGTMGVWQVLRNRRWLKSSLRGVNAAAIGLVYTAVYRLWRIGYLDAINQQGSSLDRDPWWVVITATSFFGGLWFNLQAHFAVLLGAVMGLIWFGVAKA